MASTLGTKTLHQTRLPALVCRTFTKQTIQTPPLPILHRNHFISPTVTANKVQCMPFTTTNVASFHASGRRSILPAGPQVVDGTVNDAAQVPTPSPTHGSYHWAFERLIALGVVPLTIAPFAAGTLNPIMDAILCATILIHSHIGFESCVIDYFPKRRIPKIRSFFSWLLRAATLGVGVGLYEFETNDVGLTEAIRRIWTA